jgi:hypothetical protein
METQELKHILPGGLIKEGKLYDRVCLREMTGVEEDIMIDRKLSVGRRMNLVMANCMTSLESEDGDEVDGVIDSKGMLDAVQDLTVGDRVVLMLLIREASLGPMFPMRVNCPECGEAGNYQVNLHDLVIKALPDKMVREYTETLPSGQKAKLKIMTGREEGLLTAKRNDPDFLSHAIGLRLVELEGKPVGSVHQIKALSLKDRNALRTAFEEHEGGVDTDIDITCDKCGRESTVVLDIAQKDFFFPSAT